MPFDCFMQIEGVEGESTDEKHDKWIELHSYSFGCSQAVGTVVSTGGARSGQRVDIQDFSIQKDLDKASPKIFDTCCKGTHIPKITVEVCRATGEKEKYMEFLLEDVLVTSYQPSGQYGGSALATRNVQGRRVSAAGRTACWVVTERDGSSTG